MTTALLKPPVITPKPRGNPQGPTPTSREGFHSPLAGRPHPETRTKRSSWRAQHGTRPQAAAGLTVSSEWLSAGGAQTSHRRAWGHAWSSSAWLCGAGEGSRVPHPPSREGLCSPLAGRPRPAFRTPGSSLEQNSPQGSSLQATARPTDSGCVPDEARGSQRSRESGVGQSGAQVKWLCSPGGNSRFLQQPQRKPLHSTSGEVPTGNRKAERP